MQEDLTATLAEQAERERASLGSERMIRWIALLWVPLGTAVLAAAVHRDAADLFWPPSPVVLLAPLGAYYVISRVTSDRFEIAVTMAVSAFVAVVASWGVAFAIEIFGALSACAEGRCLPAW